MEEATNHYAVDDIAQTGDPLVDIELDGEAASDVEVLDTEAISVGHQVPHVCLWLCDL